MSQIPSSQVDQSIDSLNNVIEEKNKIIAHLEEKLLFLQKALDTKNTLISEYNNLITSYVEKATLQNVHLLQLEDDLMTIRATLESLQNRNKGGRHQKFSSKQKKAICQKRAQGQTIREIATYFDCSVGVVHKILNEHKQ